MGSELEQLKKACALIVTATVTMGVAGDKIATLVEDDNTALALLDAIRDCIFVMGTVSDQAAEFWRQRRLDALSQENL